MDTDEGFEQECPSCGATRFYSRPRIAALLPIQLLGTLFMLVAVVSLVAVHWYEASLLVGLGPLAVLALSIFFVKVPAGQRWYWGGTGCRDCGYFEMLR